MGTGSDASQHWAVGVWSDDRGITHHGKGGPPKHELRLPVAASGQQRWDRLTSWLVPCHKSHWLEVLQAKALAALTWKMLDLNCEFWNILRHSGYSGGVSTFN